MNDLSRRHVLHGAAGALATLTPLSIAAATPQGLAAEDEQAAGRAEGAAPTDRDFVMGAGMTAEEADCWAVTAEAAGKFFALPELHPMDRQEVASAIHIVQNKLLSRPTYRAYLALAKAAHGG
jgi:hypothetical protein